MERLPIGNVKELRWGTELLPQLPRALIAVANFWRRVPFDGLEYRAQGSAKFELLLQAFAALRHHRQLVQPLVKLRRRFCHRRAARGPPSRIAPVCDGFFD